MNTQSLLLDYLNLINETRQYLHQKFPEQTALNFSKKHNNINRPSTLKTPEDLRKKDKIQNQTKSLSNSALKKPQHFSFTKQATPPKSNAFKKPDLPKNQFQFTPHNHDPEKDFIDLSSTKASFQALFPHIKCTSKVLKDDQAKTKRYQWKQPLVFTKVLLLSDSLLLSSFQKNLLKALNTYNLESSFICIYKFKDKKNLQALLESHTRLILCEIPSIKKYSHIEKALQYDPQGAPQKLGSIDCLFLEPEEHLLHSFKIKQKLWDSIKNKVFR